ncbi:MAG: ABC transporter permease subunit [Anaerolineales bacterium]|nr:ABC transporter permease subunit [Anaerolineales bacterium]
MFRLLVQELKFRRNAIIGWGLGLSFFPLVYIGIYPSVADEMAGLADLDIYAAMGMSIGTFGDWIGSIMIVLFPLVAAIYAIGNGTGTLAGEEEDGRLEMLVTLPLPRWQIVTAKALALTISAALIYLFISGVSWGVFEAIKNQIETVLCGRDVFLAVLSSFPFVFAMGMISMFLAVFCSSRQFATMISTAILVISYFGSNLAGCTPLLEPFEPFFLNTYLDGTGKAIAEGQAAGDQLVLLGVGLVAFILALVFFQIRKLTVGAWPWQRGRVEQ